MKKKIFFIMSTDDFSGAESVNFSIIEELNKIYDFYWVSKKGKINKFLKEKNIKWIEIQKLNVREIKRIIKENKPDILHATDYRASVICAMTNTKIPFIAHVHNNSPWLKKISINSLAFLYAAIKAKKVLIVSESIEKEYIFAKIIKNKIECIDNPISVDRIIKMVDEKDYKKKYDICCVGRLTNAKDPLRWLNIIEKVKENIPNIKCIWVGDGELKNEFESKLVELKLDNTVDFIGFQKNPYRHMASSKIYLQTSAWEGFGLTVFEALSLGLPSFVSNVGGLSKIVNNECGLLCNSDNEFICNILNILSNDEIYFEKSKNASLRAKSIDNTDTYFEKVNQNYRVLIKKGR